MSAIDFTPIVPEVLAAFGLGSARSINVLGGTATPKWDVTTEHGRFVVRIRPPEFAASDRTAFTYQTLLRLAAAGLPIPRPQSPPSGETGLSRNDATFEVLTWIDGDSWSADVVGATHGIGVFLARFHTVLAHDHPKDNPEQLREDHPDRLQAILDSLIARTDDAVAKQQLEKIKALLVQGRRELESSLYPSLPRTVIHGDFHPGNVRFHGADVAALYDFDYLAVQARARDIVVALMFFASDRSTPYEPDHIRSLTQPFIPNFEASQAVLSGYQSITPLTGW